jgi:hypothetical protein
VWQAFCPAGSERIAQNPQGQPMKQIAAWLQKLGLGQYAQRFAENDITFVILPDLTDQDLEKIGVASLGSSASAAACDCRTKRRTRTSHGNGSSHRTARHR